MDGILDSCFFCRGGWGECQCDFPESFDEEGREVPDVDGFEHGGVHVTQPNVSHCTRFFVDPAVYYGEAYLKWAARNADLLRGMTR